ncbi:MAG: biopolymer transporter ExbD [bacterium]|nr:MAG: biopolymer transporter ExbD [bacterium]
MSFDPEVRRFRSHRRPTLELGMTPLIDIVFLLLIFFMLTSRFIVSEGIQVDLPVTESPHVIPGEESNRITVRADGSLLFQGRQYSLREMEDHIRDQGPAFVRRPFEILSDRRAAVQSVVSLLEMLRDSGADRVSLGTMRAPAAPP